MTLGTLPISVVIVPGTNDLKVRFSVLPFDIANGARGLVDVVQKSATYPGGAAPQVLLLAPSIARLTDSATLWLRSHSPVQRYAAGAGLTIRLHCSAHACWRSGSSSHWGFDMRASTAA